MSCLATIFSYKKNEFCIGRNGKPSYLTIWVTVTPPTMAVAMFRILFSSFFLNKYCFFFFFEKILLLLFFWNKYCFLFFWTNIASSFFLNKYCFLFFWTNIAASFFEQILLFFTGQYYQLVCGLNRADDACSIELECHYPPTTARTYRVVSLWVINNVLSRLTKK